MAAAIAVVTVITLRTIAVILWSISYRLLALILMAIATIVMLMPVVTTLLLTAIMLLLVVTSIMLFTIIPALTIFVIVTLPNTVAIATSLTMIFLLLASLWLLSMTLLWLLRLGRSLWLTIILWLWSCLLCISISLSLLWLLLGLQRLDYHLAGIVIHCAGMGFSLNIILVQNAQDSFVVSI